MLWINIYFKHTWSIFFIIDVLKSKSLTCTLYVDACKTRRSIHFCLSVATFRFCIFLSFCTSLLHLFFKLCVPYYLTSMLVSRRRTLDPVFSDVVVGWLVNEQHGNFSVLVLDPATECSTVWSDGALARSRTGCTVGCTTGTGELWLLSYILPVDSVTATVEGPLEDEVTFGIRVDAREATTAPLVGGLA